MLPVSACVEKNALTLLCNIARDPICIENQIATRQLADRSTTDISWFSNIRNILNAYELPSAYDPSENPPSKEQWKRRLKAQLHSNIEKSWREDIASKSSLKYLNPEAVRVGKVHQIYSSVLDVRRAEVKARLLTGTYTLQSNKAKFNQHKVSPTCQLCESGPETREHFLATCSTLQNYLFLSKIKIVFNNSSEINAVLRDPVLCTHLLDSSNSSVNLILQPNNQQTTQIELYSRELMFTLHWE